MTDAPESGAAVVVVRKTVNAVASVAYDAWCEPEQLVQWFCPSPDTILAHVETDVRQGGQFRFVYARKSDGGVELEVSGVYTTVSRPKRLAFTWSWSAHMPDAGVETHVCVDFEQRGPETEITLTHTRVPGAMMRDALSSGWAAAVDTLAEWLAVR